MRTNWKCQITQFLYVIERPIALRGQVSIFLVCILTASSAARGGLIGHWQLDEGTSAATAVDSGPLGHDGSYQQSPDLDVLGISGTAMDSRSGYMTVDLGADLPVGTDARTVSIFIKPSGSHNQKFFGYGDTPPGAAFEFTAEEYQGQMGVRFRHWGGNYHFGGIKLNEWNHVCIRVPNSAAHVGDLEVFINGVEVAGVRSGGSNIPLVTAPSIVHIGTAAVGGETGILFEGLIDDVQFYDEALSDEQIEFLYSFPGRIIDQPPQGVHPNPADGALRIGPEVRLSWEASYVQGFMPRYDVYFGTVPDNLNLVSSGQTETYYDVTEVLEQATIYYWRVDVVELSGQEAIIHSGRLWSFLSWYDTMNVVEWKLDDGWEGEDGLYTSDTSGQGNMGKLYGFAESPGADWVGGIDGNCLEFSGIGEHVLNEGAAGLPLSDSDEWTMNLYVQLDERTRDWTRIAGFGDEGQRELITYRDGEFAFIYKARYLLLSGVRAGVGVWHMITIIRDANGVTMFIDGYERASIQEPFSSAREVGDKANLLWYADREGFAGKIDEFTVWDGAVSFEWIKNMSRKLPIKGDFDGNGEVNLADVAELGTDWHNDTRVVAGQLILDDFESYIGATDPAFTASWQGYQGEPGTNLLSLMTVVEQINRGNQVLKWNYDFGIGRVVGVDYWLSGAAVDLSRYDRLHIWLFKASGSTGDRLFCKFIEPDVDGKPIDAGEAWYPGGIDGLVENEWVEWEIDLEEIHSWESELSVVPYDRIKSLIGLSIGSYSEAGGAGTILFDDLRLVGDQDRCLTENLMRADTNGDCVVGMLDLKAMAQNWLIDVE